MSAIAPPPLPLSPTRYSKESCSSLFALWAVSYLVFVVCSMLGSVLEFALALDLDQVIDKPTAEGTLYLLAIGLGFLAAIPAAVFGCMILYRSWAVLQGHGARTTPGKAVGFGFIPIFWFYWWFIAFAGLAQDNNRYMNAAGIPGPRLNYGLAMALCVLAIADFISLVIPAADLLLSLPSAIVGVLFVMQQKNCLIAIINHRNAELQTALPPQG